MRVRLVIRKKELCEVPRRFGTWVFVLLSKPFIKLVLTIAFDFSLAYNHSFKTKLASEFDDLLLRIWLFLCILVAWNENNSQFGSQLFLEFYELFVVSLSVTSLRGNIHDECRFSIFY